MQALKRYKEKRKEPRFALQVPALIRPDLMDPGAIFKANIEDMSLHGLKTCTDSLLQPGQEVRVSYAQPLSGEESELQGQVKWVGNGEQKFKLGIELLEKNNCLISLEQASSFLKPFCEAEEPGLEARHFATSSISNTFYHELYWGLLFKTFREHLQNNLTRLCNWVNLSSVHTQKMLHEKSTGEPDQEQTKRLSAALNKLDKAGQDLQGLATLFKTMQAESIDFARERHKDLPGMIEMDKRLQGRLQAFQDKLQYLMMPSDPALTFQSCKTALIFGSTWCVDQGLDLLILHAYQFLLTGNATRIDIRLQEKQKVIQLDFSHDGSGILFQNHRQVMLNLETNVKNNLHPARDKMQLLWLHYILSFFQEFEPNILVHSEPGNNLVSLRLRTHC